MKMNSLLTKLTSLFASAFDAEGLPRTFGHVVISDRPDLGQFQCNGALAAAKQAKKNPRAIAESIVVRLQEEPCIESLSIAGPGFINIVLADSFLATHMSSLSKDKRLGAPQTEEQKHIMVDFGGPNVAKPMHVGHLRSSIIGDCLQRICHFMDYKVTSDIHLGDWGLQMGMLIHELQRREPALNYFDENFEGPYDAESPVNISDLQKMYPEASARCKSDPKEMTAAREALVELQKFRPGYFNLWQHFVRISNKELKDDFSKLNVHFDLWNGESDYHSRIPSILEQLEAQGSLKVSDGAKVVEVHEESDKNPMPPLILVKSDGGYLYGTTDLATIAERVDDLKVDKVFYVVDKRQHLHFEQVFRAAQKTSIKQDCQLEHIGFGTMNGPDGKPFKTRAGGVMRLSDLISQVKDKALARMNENNIASEMPPEERESIAAKIGIATLKYADLSNHRSSDYIFDLDNFSKFEGKTGPYLQYTAVRIQSILRKAQEQSLQAGEVLPPSANAERDLMLAMSRLPDRILLTFKERAPNHLCEFTYELAQAFSKFYSQCHILKEENKAQQASWLALCELCLRQFQLTFKLLGIEVPERM